MKITLVYVFLLMSICGYAQNSAVTQFQETHGTALSLYFYPSTLRMVNLDRNKEFDALIRNIKKARFFRMDSGMVTKDDLQKLTEELLDEGFEEMMFIKNKDMDVKVWGIEKRTPETIIISRADHEVMLLEVNGMINIAKIPRIMEAFNENAFLDVLNLNEKKPNGQRTNNK